MAVSPEAREKMRETARKWGQANRELVRERSRKWYLENKERRAASAKTWRLANPEKVKALADKNRETQRKAAKRWREANKEYVAARVAKWAKENPERRNASCREYARRNPHMGRAQNAAYLAAQIQATPAWSDRKAVLAFYEMAQWMQDVTGEPYHVDHIVPLRSKIVCGLHCEANLQVLAASDNCSKSNKFVWSEPTERTGLVPWT